MARSIRDAKGNRLPFLSPYPKFPFGDYPTLNARERLAAMRADASYRPPPIMGVFKLYTPEVVVSDPELIQKVFFKSGEVYERPEESLEFVVMKALIRAC